MIGQIHPWLALGVAASTAATDAVYVMFSAAVSSRRRVPAATWSSVWYLLSAFAVISYTRNWVYVCFAALGSWVGAYVSMTVLRRPDSHAGGLDRGEPKPVGLDVRRPDLLESTTSSSSVIGCSEFGDASRPGFVGVADLRGDARRLTA